MTTSARAIEMLINPRSEIRARGEGKDRVIYGYAAVFDSPSEDLGGFVEVIKPGAFTRALREAQDVRCLFNHDPNKVLGRSASKTLTLTEDRKGLYFECRMPETKDAADVLALIERQDVSGCSFRFSVNRSGATPGARWVFTNVPGTPDIRQILDVDLIDVGPCTDPAYPATEVSSRDYASARAEHLAGQGTPTRMARLRLAELDVAG